MKRGPTLKVRNATFIDVGTAYRLRGDVELDADGDKFLRVGVGYDAQEQPEIPKALVDEVIKRLSVLQDETGREPTEDDVDRAADKSGLKKWLSDNSLNIANLTAQLTALYFQIRGP